MEGRAAAHQAGHCQQLPHQHYHLCWEQAEPSLVGWVLGAHCTSLIGVWHGDTCMKGYGCDLMGGFLTSTHVGGSQGAGWVQVESHRSRRVCKQGDTALPSEKVHICSPHGLLLRRGSAHNCVQH